MLALLPWFYGSKKYSNAGEIHRPVEIVIVDLVCTAGMVSSYSVTLYNLGYIVN